MIEPGKAAFKIFTGAIFLLGLVWQQTQATRLGYEVERARQQERIIKSRLGALQVQLETSLSPFELASRAKAMGMVQADPQALRILGCGQSHLARQTFLSRLFPKSWKALLST